MHMIREDITTSIANRNLGHQSSLNRNTSNIARYYCLRLALGRTGFVGQTSYIPNNGYHASDCWRLCDRFSL